MSNWLSDPNNSNRFKQTYVLGFVDVSGNLVVRNGRMNILVDSSFNGNIYANASITANKNVYVLGDTSFNGNITCFKDASFSNGLYVGGNVNVNGSDFRLKDVVLQKTGTISGSTTLSVPLNQMYNISATGDINITLPKISSSRLEGSEITFYKTASASNTVTLYSDAEDGLVTYGTITSTNTFAMPGSKTSVKFVVSPNRWVEVGSSAIASVDGSFVNIRMSGNMYVLKDASFSGNMYVLKDASFGGNIILVNDASFGGNMKVSRLLRGFADASFGGNLFVLRDASFGSNLIVVRDASFGGNVKVSGNLRAFSDASFGGNLYVLKDASFGNNLTVIKDVNIMGNTLTSDIYGNEKYRDFFSYDFTNTIGNTVENLITKNYDAVFSGTGVSVSGGNLIGTSTSTGLRIIPNNTTILNYFTVSIRFKYTQLNSNTINLFSIRGTNSAISEISIKPYNNSFTISTNNRGSKTDKEYAFDQTGNTTYVLKYQQYINTTNPVESSYIITITNTSTNATETFTGVTDVPRDNLKLSEILCGYNGTSLTTSYSISDFTFGTFVTDNVYVNSILNMNRDAIFYGNVTSTRDTSFGGNMQVSGTVRGITDASFGGNLFVLRDASFGSNITVIQESSFGGNIRVSGTVRGITDASFGGNMFVLRDASFGGNVIVSRTLRGINDASFGGNLFVLRDASFGSNLFVIRDAFFGGNVRISDTLRGINDASFGGNLFVLRDASFGSNLFVIRDASFGGNVRISDTLRGINDASFGGNMFVLRDASFGSNLFVIRDASFGGNVRISETLRGINDASFGGNLFVLRDASFSSNLFVIRDASFGGNVRITDMLRGINDASFGGNLFVLRDASFGSNLFVIRDASFGGNVRISETLRGINDASFGGNLFVLRDASFGGNVSIIRDASFGGNVRITGVLRGITDASFGGNLFVTKNILFNNLSMNTENITRGNATSLENLFTTKNTLPPDSIATSYDGRYVYYIDNNNTDGTNNTRSIYKSSNYGETFTLLYNYTATPTSIYLSKIETNQYGNTIVVGLKDGFDGKGYILLKDSLAPARYESQSYLFSDIKMNSSGSFIHFAAFVTSTNKGIFTSNDGGDIVRGNLISSTTNSSMLYKTQPLYYTTNNESIALPARTSLGDSTSTNISYVYLYTPITLQTITSNVGVDATTFTTGVIQADISTLGFKWEMRSVSSSDSGCSANTPDNSVKIAFFVSNNSPTKILKVVANSDYRRIATSLTPTCFTSTSPEITITGICCGDTGQNLYIGTTTGLYYMYDPSPMTSNIANNTISLIPGTAGFNITSITCSKTTDYVYFSTEDKKMYRYMTSNNIIMEFDQTTNNVGVGKSNPQVELDVAGSARIDKNLFVNTVAVTNNHIIQQNKFTLSTITSPVSNYGLYPDSIATSYDGRYVYYLDSAIRVRDSTYQLNSTDLYWYRVNNPDFTYALLPNDSFLQLHWTNFGFKEIRTYLEPLAGNIYSRVMKSTDYGKSFSEVYNISNLVGGNTLTKIATNNSGSDVVFQRKKLAIGTDGNDYCISYSTDYGTTYGNGYNESGATLDVNSASLSYNGTIVLAGYFESNSSGVRKLNSISSTSLQSVLTTTTINSFKMYGAKLLYYSGDVFSFLHNSNDSVANPTAILNFVYYIPSTTTGVSFSNIDFNGNLTSSNAEVSTIKVSGNLSAYNIIVPSSTIRPKDNPAYNFTTNLPGNKSTGCTANTPDGSVKIAFIISHSSPTKILKIAYDGKSMIDSCITIPGVTITGVCCGENGQHLYIATTKGLYYLLDTSPMTSNIADQKVMLIADTDQMNITAITCSRTSEYVYFSTVNGNTENRLYKLFNNIMFEYVGQDSELLIKPYSGNVGIRNSNPQFELDVGGSVNISNTLYVNRLSISNVNVTGNIIGLRDASFGGNLVVINDGSFNRNFKIGGDLIVNGSVTATAFNAMSDKRLKSNIQVLPSQWENIKMLQPSEYTWRDSYVRDYGFVAQQVFDIYPHMRTKFHSPTLENTTLDEPINIHGEPQYYSLDYSKMTTMLCKGLQEAMDVIEKQQVEIDGLKRKIDAVHDRLGPDV